MDYHIFLIGFMGSGKSTVAGELSRRLGIRKVEMDDLIVEKQGMAITDIFAKYGESYFRDLESAVLIELQKDKGTVVSCGGGIIVREANTGHMRKSGHIVLLTATPETIYHRVKGSDARPILNGNMNVEYISGLLEKRRSLYEAAADVTVATDGKSVAQICDEILEKLSALDKASPPRPL